MDSEHFMILILSSFFLKREREREKKKKKKRVCFIGHFMYHTNISLLTKSLNMINNQYPEKHLSITT